MKKILEDNQQLLHSVLISKNYTGLANLVNQNEFRPAINKDYEKTNFIGSGSYGKVYNTTIKIENELKEYAVKKLMYEGQWKPEMLTKDTIYRDNFENKLVLDRNTLLCSNQNSIFSECLISLLLAEAVRTKECLYFIEAYSFNLFKNSCYLFMEKIDDNFLSFCNRHKSQIDEEMFDSLYIQVLQAIAFYSQREYLINHHDIRSNLFIRYDKKILDLHKDKNLADKKFEKDGYLSFTIGKKTMYIPYYGIIIKIGDFGLSNKYAEPAILNDNQMEGILIDTENYIIELSNTYNPIFDILDVTYAFYRIKETKLILNVLQHYLNTQFSRYFDNKYFMPIVSKLKTVSTDSGIKLLSFSYFKDYYTVPDSDKIENMGQVTDLAEYNTICIRKNVVDKEGNSLSKENELSKLAESNEELNPDLL